MTTDIMDDVHINRMDAAMKAATAEAAREVEGESVIAFDRRIKRAFQEAWEAHRAGREPSFA